MLGFILQLGTAADFMEKVKQATGARVNARDMLLAVFAGLALGIVLFMWTYLRFRKKRQETEARALGRLASEPAAATRSEGEPRPRRRKRRRRAHRPRNPSLHQTGGLPPKRPDDELPKY